MPSISVITVSFNNLSELIETCQSVDVQQSLPYEHLVIDGSSNREIETYLAKTPQPSYRKWLSEPDKGIADAFNKGINLATGKFVVMLNSGDILFDAGVLTSVQDTLMKDTCIKWLHGKYKLFRGNKWVIIGKPYEKKKLYRGMRSICHQTMFVSKDLHDKYGLYDTSVKIAMDYDLLCRIAKEPFAFIHTPMVVFNPSGVSSMHYMESLKQAKNIYEKYFGRSILLYLWQVRLKVLYYLLKSPAGNLLYKIKTGLKLENL